MVTNLYLPNTDWDNAQTRLKTLLSDQLFQKLKDISEISCFVREIFCAYPEFAATALNWQVQVKDKVFRAEIIHQFEQFCDISDVDEARVMQLLRLFRRTQSAAIAVLELSREMPVDSSSLRISLLADCLISAARYWCHQQACLRFGKPEPGPSGESELLILAMGKLGGLELNFSSDIDLIFFYPEDGMTSVNEFPDARQVDNSRFFRYVATQLIKLLDEATQDGFVFRVDMRLRPYGESGAIVMSLTQAEEYYQEQGREWERFAMLRARITSGSSDDRVFLNNIIQPFSFRRYVDYGVIDSIRSMKQMILREVRRKGLTNNIKLGAGGIREVEFIVQSLQLIQGGRDKRLQEKNTLKVLPLLVDAKLLAASTADELSGAYRFLRRLEHCIQELAEKQTQQLPENEQEQQSLVIAMNVKDWAELLAQLSEVQQRVNHCFTELFDEEQREEALQQDDFFQSLAEGHVSACQLQNKLKTQHQLVLSEKVASEFIQRVNLFLEQQTVKNLSSRGTRRLSAFFPALLVRCLLCESPVMALNRLLKVIQAILKRTAYLELFAENPPILQQLVDLAGRSDWVVRRLSDYPILFDELLYPNSLYEPLQAGDLKSELQQALLRADESDEEELLDTLRTFKQTNELRVAAALLAERLNISQVSRYLTQLAEVILQSSLDLCWNLLRLKYGLPAGLSGQPGDYGFAIVGYGKLGGEELGFGSDLDLVFLYNQSVDGVTTGKRAISCSRFYTRLAQKLIHFLSIRTNLGFLYEVDMRLRPSGASGLLVSHIDAYHEYQTESAWTWEHQALVRARYVAGDINLKVEFELVRQKTLIKPVNIQKLKKDVVTMRNKMREALLKVAPGKVDLKQTQGGLVDIEFLSQYFCLSYYSDSYNDNHSDNQLPTNTVEGLKLAANEKRLTKADVRLLIDCYRHYRNQLNEMALMEKTVMVEQKIFENALSQVKKIWQEILPD